MLKIKKISLILVILALSGCTSEWVANKYLPTVFKAGKYPNGGWIVAEVRDKNGLVSFDTVAGELISFQDHKLYILGIQKMNVIPDTSVYRARLYMYKKQPGVFALVTLFGILPNFIAAIALPEYAGQFLALGIVPLVIGTTFTVTELATNRNQLIFPQRNTLEDFIKFSRFPQGLPSELNIHQLKLPEVN